MLELQNIQVSVNDAEVVHNVSILIPNGKVAALMGPNGSGKSSLVNAVMGHPRYHLTQGYVVLDGEDITNVSTDEKAKKGIFLSLQNPPAIPGITVSSFLRNAVQAWTGKNIPVMEFKSLLEQEMQKIGMEREFASRYVHEGFSGGEKKRLEALQLILLKPKYALLDETDSGLDVDALKIIARNIQRVSAEMGILLITHYTRILQYLVPDEVYIMREGRIVQRGGKELADKIEKQGYMV
ncbi:MAG: Fe-S cluster assembly ATP-binding protein [Parcubacteria group bacterium Gr01-1014_29]|nr:MAG: Fe-S cluster assembly ATP-binding protein [Parcubacteria group bacterium Gr01-1014_29]